MQSTDDDLGMLLLRRLAEVADLLEALVDRIAWDTYIESEQRTAGQLVDHIAWAWEVESAAFRAIAGGAAGSGWTQEWLDTQNAEQAAISAKRSRREVMARYRFSRDLALAFIRGLNGADLQRSGTHMPGAPARTVAGWIEVCLIGHPMAHLQQMQSAVIGSRSMK